MIIDILSQIAKRGAQFPLWWWKEEFESMRAELLPDLEVLASELPDDSDATIVFRHFLEVLKQDQTDEYLLAKALLKVLELILQDVPDSSKHSIGDLQKNFAQFHKRATEANLYKGLRTQMKTQLDPEKQKAHDHQLSYDAGMMYGLEYYLTLLKSMDDAPNEKAVQAIITRPEIDIGSGKVPGLWFDIMSDDILSKYVYSLLDDSSRDKLLHSYFQLKEFLLQISVQCDPHGQCVVEGIGEQMGGIRPLYVTYIFDFFDVFESLGIHSLRSIFLTPYGKKPEIAFLRKQLIV